MKIRAFAGYTILETMLFIAISSAMFLMAVTTFSGRQQQIQFTQAVRELDAKLRDTINDVTTGYYSNSGNISCTVQSGRPFIVEETTAVGLGTDVDCVLVGKAIQFFPEVNTTNLVENQDLMYIYNVVGLKGTLDSTPTNLHQSKPTATSPTSTGATYDDVTEKSNLKFGLRVTRVATVNGATIDEESSLIGFFTRFTKTIGITTLSENQSVSSAIIPGVDENSDQYQAVNVINKITDSTPSVGEIEIDVTSTKPIVICMQDPTKDDRKASITIGGSGQATTKVDFDTYNKDVCD